MAQQQMPRQIQIELPEEVAEGIYANFAVITHSPSEFVIDFARMVPGAPKAKVQTRVIMTPMNAKMLLKALEDNIKNSRINSARLKHRINLQRLKAQLGLLKKRNRSPKPNRPAISHRKGRPSLRTRISDAG